MFLPLVKLIRPHQWVKNTFVFVGLLFGHAWHDQDLVMQVVLVFVAFCLVSSAIYSFNDIIDLEQDRRHPTKRHRPLAAGILPIPVAVGAMVFLGSMGMLVAFDVSPVVFGLLAGYAVLNIAYSLRLKHVVILDVFIIAAGFMLRILVGTLGVGIPPSQWLLLCGLMATLFLGFTKRRAEIIALSEEKVTHRRVLEHYSPVLLDKMIGITASGLIMTYSLYTMSAETIKTHGTTNLIYAVPFVVYAVFRYIYLLHHQNLGGDPSRDLVRDPHLLIAAGGWLICTVGLVI